MAFEIPKMIWQSIWGIWIKLSRIQWAKSCPSRIAMFVCACVWNESSLQHAAVSGSLTDPFIIERTPLMSSIHVQSIVFFKVTVQSQPCQTFSCEWGCLFCWIWSPGWVQLQARPNQHHLPKGNHGACILLCMIWIRMYIYISVLVVIMRRIRILSITAACFFRQSSSRHCQL